MRSIRLQWFPVEDDSSYCVDTGPSIGYTASLNPELSIEDLRQNGEVSLLLEFSYICITFIIDLSGSSSFAGPEEGDLEMMRSAAFETSWAGFVLLR